MTVSLVYFAPSSIASSLSQTSSCAAPVKDMYCPCWQVQQASDSWLVGGLINKFVTVSYLDKLWTTTNRSLNWFGVFHSKSSERVGWPIQTDLLAWFCTTFTPRKWCSRPMSFTLNLADFYCFHFLITLSCKYYVIDIYCNKEHFSFWGFVDAGITVCLLKAHFSESSIQSCIPASWWLFKTTQATLELRLQTRCSCPFISKPSGCLM